MFRNLDLTFERGTILTKEMLQEVYGAPRETASIIYNEYPEGILAGTQLIGGRDGAYWVTKGLIKYDGRIYRMPQDLNLSAFVSSKQLSDNEFYRLAFVKVDPEAIDKRDSQVQHALIPSTMLASEPYEGVEYGLFRLNYKHELEPFRKPGEGERPFWDMTNCHYALRNGTTFHPHVFEEIRPVLLEAGRGEAWEYVVLDRLTMCGVLGMDLLLAILKSRGLVFEAWQRDEILKALHELKVTHDVSYPHIEKHASPRQHIEPLGGML